MTNKESVYNANSIEKYWQKVWDKESVSKLKILSKIRITMF